MTPAEIKSRLLLPEQDPRALRVVGHEASYCPVCGRVSCAPYRWEDAIEHVPGLGRDIERILGTC